MVSEWNGVEIIGNVEQVTSVESQYIDATFSFYEVDFYVQAFGEFKLQNIESSQVILTAGETQIRKLITRFYAGQNNYMDITMDYWATGEDVDEVVFETRSISTKNTENNTASYNQGYADGVQSQQNAIITAEKKGYNNGYKTGVAQASNLGNILLGIGGAPVEMITQMLDFELLGINIANLVMSILTAALCVWVIKMFV